MAVHAAVCTRPVLYLSGATRLRIGYTLGSQCIPGIYARWFLITHEGVISKPPRVFPGIHGYLGYNQFVG